jgi:hypothetical protein
MGLKVASQPGDLVLPSLVKTDTQLGDVPGLPAIGDVEAKDVRGTSFSSARTSTAMTPTYTARCMNLTGGRLLRTCSARSKRCLRLQIIFG